MYHYAQIEKREDGYGYMVADSYLSGEVISENMIPITDPIDYTNHRWNYDTEQWEEYTPEPEPAPEPKPTQLDNIEESQLIIMEAMADQYEQSVETELTNMEVMATIYEQLLAMEGVE